jgi:hypothetical protein
MSLNLDHELKALRSLSPSALRVRYAELFGEPTRSGNKVWLIKRIAWRLQALAEGDLSERARRRAEELANDADLRLSPPRNLTSARALAQGAQAERLPPGWDRRLPPPGSLLTRRYKGQLLQVKILSNGVELDGKRYRSLSALANALTGAHCNGFAFFRLGHKGEDQ